MAISSIKKLIPPPKKPIDTGTEDDWKEAEKRLGLSLPKDYKDFIKTYGSGYLSGFIWIFNPLSKEELNLEIQARMYSEFFKDLGIKHPLFPEKGGLLAFGNTDNGDVFFWQTEGNEEKWPIIVWENRSDKHEFFKADLTSLIAGLISGKIKTSIFPENFMKKSFAPINPAKKY